MDIIIQILELLSKFGSGLSTTALLGVISAVLIYMIRDDKAYRIKTDERFKQVLNQQKEMTKEYQEGFEKIHQELSLQREAIASLKEQQQENQQMTLRSIVTNKNLPIEYRLINYDLYKKNGGNSWLDKYVKEEFGQDDK